ncbi:MAG: acetyl-CoA carboxylase biotin carboxylase subunit [Deltaproteobacteria bacterium]|nr:acetyl-CoA carboxylase biotin carboxylase subunit [Deltaproteobacteria bacterium]MBW2535547.1 acetyl-CoA carboxylase biotin carboxylase subunit [Deltaproteobacteria bacterium]
MFRKILIANRGEIAVRIIRTLREMGIGTVAVYSDADRAALHVRLADEAVHIGPPLVAESYLRVDRIVDAAKRTGAEAVHPGYGFLSENEQFAAACDDDGIVFIGPPAQAVSVMGSKTEARARMTAAGVPVVPGGRASSAEEAQQTASELGYPVMIKAAFGGGGKGMRLVGKPEDLAGAYERAKSEAEKAFGDGTVYLEKAIVEPRHVEIQVLGDRDGHVVHLFERDCSIQRRHQKVVEETPSPAASDELVAEMGEVAVQAAKAVGYYSAGTVEFLLDPSGSFYFLEMNTRLQVEHPVTEWITGVDLVREMVRIAAGESLGYEQQEITRRGASIECRIYAEDPATGFLPSPGLIESLRTPAGPFVRDDSGVYSGAEISSYYDPLISKLTVWGLDRPAALARMRRALAEYAVTGIRTNLAFHERLLGLPAFVEGKYHTGTLEQFQDQLLRDPGDLGDQVARDLAVALACAAAEAESAAPLAAADSATAGLSPWVMSHRGRW